MKKAQQLLIADDHEIVRYGLRSLIEAHFPQCAVEEADSYDSLITKLHQTQFTHLVLDLRLHELNMLEKFPVFRQQFPGLFIIIHTSGDQAGYAGWLIGLGANGFLSKESSQEETIAALGLFLRDHVYVSADVVRHKEQLEYGKPGNDPFERLSPRERQLVHFLLKGNTSKEIQNTLGIKSSTVSTMKNRIFQKLNVSNFIALIKLADTAHFK